MLKLNYIAHILLSSKYRLIITLSIYTLIYILLKNNHAVYCMTENDLVPTIAETKSIRPKLQPSHQVIALREEIKEFAGSQATLIETQELLLEKIKIRDKEMMSLREELSCTKTENAQLIGQVACLKGQKQKIMHDFSRLQMEHNELIESIYGESYASNDGY